MKKDLFEYYNIDILSIYKNRPNKYIVYTDNFESENCTIIHIRLTPEFIRVKMVLQYIQQPF